MANEYEDVASTVERLDAENRRLRAILGRLTLLVPLETRDAGNLDIEAITATANEARAALGEE